MAYTLGPAQSRNLILSWRGLLGVAAFLIGAVWALGFLQDILLFVSGAGTEDMVWAFDVDSEEGLLTWMSIVLLFSASAILFANGQSALERGAVPVLPWFLLSLLFALVSFDEFYGLHERLSDALSRMLDQGGVLHFAWALPFGLLSLFGLWLFLPFLRSLGRRTCSLALLSAGLFLLGAVGMEMIGGLMLEEFGRMDIRYRVLTNLEEGLEVMGVLLFIYTILQHREALDEV